MGQGYDGSDWLAGYGVCAEEGLFGWLSEKLDESGPFHPFLPFLPYQPPSPALSSVSAPPPSCLH